MKGKKVSAGPVIKKGKRDCCWEQKITKKQLEISEKSLMLALEHTNIQYWEYDMYNKRAYIGERSRRDFLLQEVMEDFPESWFSKGFVHPDYINDYRKMIEKINQGVKDVAIEGQILNKEGKYIWQEIRYSNIFDEEQKPIKAIGTSIDITERKNAEARYREIESYREVIDKMAMASFRFNLTKNWCGDGHSKVDEILKLQKDYRADAFFNRYRIFQTNRKQNSQFRKIFNIDNMKENFAKGITMLSHEHKCCFDGRYPRWVRLTANLVVNPVTRDLEGILYLLDINEAKLEEMFINGIVSTEFDEIVQLNMVTDDYVLYSGRIEENKGVCRDTNYSEKLLSHAENFVDAKDREYFLQR